VVENHLNRTLGEEPATSYFDLVVEGGRISTAWDPYRFDVFANVGYLFGEWVSRVYPGDLELMLAGPFGTLPPRLDPESIALWERRTEEFASSPASAISSGPPTIAAYQAPVRTICSRAFVALGIAAAGLGLSGGWTLEDEAAWNEAAARLSEDALAEIRALPPPEGDQAPFAGVFQVMQQLTDLLFERAAAASAGDAALVETLGGQLDDLSNARVEAGGPAFRSCP
jgi:hypothetical protein